MPQPLPNGVEDIVEYLARYAKGYDNHLKWNEFAKLKADMMNVPSRWLVITSEQLREKSLAEGMRPEDVSEMVDYLERRKEGRRLVPSPSYRDFRFAYEVDTPLDTGPIRRSGSLR